MNRSIDPNPAHRTTLAVRVWIVLVLVGVASVPPPAGAQAGANRLATSEELRQMHASGQYRICLQQIGCVLRAGNAGKSYDRYDLLLLRGDCLLHLDDPATAEFAYAAAAKSPDAQQAREGRAMTFLLHRSQGMKYRPLDEQYAGDAISLTSEAGRVRALRALLNDELRANMSNFEQAEKADNLVPIQNALPKLEELYAIERTATGGDSKLRPTLEAIGNRARMLLDRDLDLREQSIASVERQSNAVVDAPAGGWWGGYVRHGLSSYDRGKLRNLIEYLQRVEETARLGRQLAFTFDGDATTWEPFIARASKAIHHAQDVLDAE